MTIGYNVQKKITLSKNFFPFSLLEMKLNPKRNMAYQGTQSPTVLLIVRYGRLQVRKMHYRYHNFHLSCIKNN